MNGIRLNIGVRVYLICKMIYTLFFLSKRCSRKEGRHYAEVQKKRRYYSLRGPGIERGREDGEHGTCPKMFYTGVEVGGSRRANTRKGSHMSEDYDRVVRLDVLDKLCHDDCSDY